MASWADRFTMVAGAELNNILAGHEIEFEEVDVYLELGVESDAAPTTASPVITVITGPDIIARNRPIGQANRMPQYPTDFRITDAVGAFQHKIVNLRNADTVSHVIQVAAKTTPL